MWCAERKKDGAQKEREVGSPLALALALDRTCYAVLAGSRSTRGIKQPAARPTSNEVAASTPNAPFFLSTNQLKSFPTSLKGNQKMQWWGGEWKNTARCGW